MMAGFNMEFSKGEMRDLRRLTGFAYQREMALELEKLAESFLEWQRKNIDEFTLDERIHRYHHGAHRKLYSRYVTYPRPEFLVANALVQGFIAAENIPAPLRAKLKPFEEWIQRGEEKTQREEPE